METSSIVQYGLVFVGLPIALYIVLKALGIIGKKAPAIVEAPERGTKRVKATRSHILICGPSGSGKTALINYLGTNEWRETVSSLEINKAQFTVSSKVVAESTDNEQVTKSVKLKYVDVPGHEHFLEDLLDNAEAASAILLVIDSKDRDTFPHAVEMLFELLNNCRTVTEEKLPIMIVCNKQDQSQAKRATNIEMDLEKELDEVRRVKVATRDPDREYVGYLESLKSRFEFKHVSDFVQICEASIKGNCIYTIACS